MKQKLSWQARLRINSRNYLSLTEPLHYFVEATEDKVDERLDKGCSRAIRIMAAAKRYELGHNANVILEEIEQRHSGEAVGSVGEQ